MGQVAGLEGCASVEVCTSVSDGGREKICVPSDQSDLREKTYVTARADADTALPISVRSQAPTARMTPRHDMAFEEVSHPIPRLGGSLGFTVKLPRRQDQPDLPAPSAWATIGEDKEMDWNDAAVVSSSSTAAPPPELRTQIQPLTPPRSASSPGGHSLCSASPPGAASPAESLMDLEQPLLMLSERQVRQVSGILQEDAAVSSTVPVPETSADLSPDVAAVVVAEPPVYSQAAAVSSTEPVPKTSAESSPEVAAAVIPGNIVAALAAAENEDTQGSLSGAEVAPSCSSRAPAAQVESASPLPEALMARPPVVAVTQAPELTAPSDPAVSSHCIGASTASVESPQNGARSPAALAALAELVQETPPSTSAPTVIHRPWSPSRQEPLTVMAGWQPDGL